MSDDEHVALSEHVTLRTIATPGHTPDHHAYILEAGGRLAGLFSGGSLMVGAVGRTDLCGPKLAEPLAHRMYQSLRRFDDLPGSLVVYPTHGAGSFCSAPGASERTTTLERERASNALLQLASEDEFVERLLAGFGTFPSYFERLPEVNRVGPKRHDTLPSLARLSVDEVARQLASGAVLVDVRPFVRFGAGLIQGSLSNTLRPVFGSWLGWLVPHDRPLLFVLEPDQDRADLVRQCLDVGHESLVGELDGGIAAWSENGGVVTTIPVVDADHLASTVIDVRQANEYASGHIPGATNVELASIAAADLPCHPFTIMCGHGERAMTAASLIAGVGRRDISVFDGGPETWSAATGSAVEAAS